MFTYDFSIASDTFNAQLNNANLSSEIANSSIAETPLDVSSNGDTLSISFAIELTLTQQTTLLAIINAHDGSPDTEEVIPSEVKIIEEVASAPFASKTLATGQKLFRRKHGIKQTIPANSTENLELVVPYSFCKVNKVEIINSTAGDTVNFKVYDNSVGSISTVPNLMLNQFGFDVVLPSNFYVDKSNYDADLINGMKISVEYTNTKSEDVEIGINIILHEMI